MSARRKTYVLVSAAVLTLAIVVGVIVLSVGGGDPIASDSDRAEASAQPQVTPTPVAAPTLDPAHPDDQVERVTDDLLAGLLPVVAEIDPAESRSLQDQLANVATAGFVGELDAERLEFESEGWTRRGSYKIERVEVLGVDLDASPATASVRACIDTSGLVITRGDGVKVTSDQARAWNIFSLKQVDGSWLIDARTFADNPQC